MENLHTSTVAIWIVTPNNNDYASFQDNTERVSPDHHGNQNTPAPLAWLWPREIYSNDPPCLNEAVEIQRPDMNWLTRLRSFHDLTVPDVNDDMLYWSIEKEQVARL
jgi:hypothetical protein